jgi:hypothetical protein
LPRSMITSVSSWQTLFRWWHKLCPSVNMCLDIPAVYLLNCKLMYLKCWNVMCSLMLQGGLIGLLRGIEKFDASRGFRISTYVYWWIRQVGADFLVLQQFGPNQIIAELSLLFICL